MPDSRAQLKQINSLPIAWLSEGKLKHSILVRHMVTSTDETQQALVHLLQDQASEHTHHPVLPKRSEPDRETMLQASDDYMRCVLAKSVAEVYKKVTPKYRNEAARKQLFKRLANIVEAIHLTESSARLREILYPSEKDEVVTWVSLELDRLGKQKVDLASEYRGKLTAARAEFASSLRQLESLVGITLTESDRFKNGHSVVVTSFFPPGVTESEKTWRWGSQWYAESGVLNINPPILFLDTLRKAVLAREAAILLSPKNMDGLESEPRELCEQSEYLAYKFLERKHDRELWSESRHGLRQKTRFRAHELIDFFHFYEMMVGDSLYRELWSRLKELGNARISASDYFSIFSSLASRPTSPKFDDVEARLLDLLCKRPNVAVGQAARQLSLSIPTAMKTIKDLTRKAGLLFTVVVDMSKIGLTEYLVLINTAKKAEILRILSRFPYCRQVFRTYGSFDLFVVLDIPEERGNFVREFLERMLERKLLSGYKLLQLNRNFQAVNFGSYDPSLGRWVIHWDTWGVRLQGSLSNHEFTELDYPTNSRRFQFDKLDLNILQMMVVDCRTSFSSMGRNLGVSGAYVGRKVARMLRENVFRYALWPLKIGAEDWGLVALSTPRQVASTLVKYLSWLPAWRGGSVSGDFEGLLAMVWSPNGELKQLFKAIDDRLVRNGHAQVECLNAIGEWALARWLPVTRDDPWQACTDDGKWLFDEQRYKSMIM